MKSPNEFTSAYAKAVREASVEAYVNLYDNDVRIFDLWDDWSAQGIESCRTMAKEWFLSLGTEHVVVTFSEIEVSTDSQFASITGFVRFAGHAADGKQLRFLDERISVVLKKQTSGEWKVTHQHTSAPIGSADMKIKMVK